MVVLGEAGPRFPARSVLRTVMVFVPEVRVLDVTAYVPSAATTAVPTAIPLLYSVMVLPASAVPENVGVLSLLIRSVLEEPVSLAAVSVGASGAAGSTVSIRTVWY